MSRQERRARLSDNTGLYDHTNYNGEPALVNSRGSEQIELMGISDQLAQFSRGLKMPINTMSAHEMSKSINECLNDLRCWMWWTLVAGLVAPRYHCSHSQGTDLVSMRKVNERGVAGSDFSRQEWGIDPGGLHVHFRQVIACLKYQL